MRNVVNLVFKKLVKPQDQFVNKFYKTQHTAYVIDRVGKVCKISRRGNVGGTIDWQRITCGYRFNYWIPTDYVVRCGGTVIDYDDTLLLDFYDQFELGGKTYVGTVELANIANIQGIQFNKKLLNVRQYNKTKRDKTIEQALANTKIAILEGVANCPHVDQDVDGVIMPGFNQYTDNSEYYETVFHEISHYVRFRDFNVDQDSIDDYSVYCTEEIIVEIAATKIAQAFNLKFDFENSANYINYYACELACEHDLSLDQTKDIINDCEQQALLTSNRVLLLMGKNE